MGVILKMPNYVCVCVCARMCVAKVTGLMPSYTLYAILVLLFP